MQAEFSIRVDIARHLVRITMSGFFLDEDIARFVAARNDAHRLLQSAPNEHLTLVDIRDMDIQAQETVGRFQQVLSDPATVSRRIAFVVARSLARMQVQRAASNREARYFMDPQAAEVWLLDE